MTLQVFLAATLRRHVPGYDPGTGLALETSPGWTVRGVARHLGVPEDEVKLIMVEGKAGDWETVLAGNERVAFFPPVGGG